MKKIERLMEITQMALIATTLVAISPITVAAQRENMLYLVEFEATESGAPKTRE